MTVRAAAAASRARRFLRALGLLVVTTPLVGSMHMLTGLLGAFGEAHGHASSFGGVGASPELQAASEPCAPRRTPARRRRPVRRPPPRRPPRPVVTQAYVRMRARWHRPPTATERRVWLAQPRPPLVLRPVGGSARFTLVPDAHGHFDAEALGLARQAFVDRDDGASTDVHPRLLELCYRAVRQFRAPYVYLVSGYRTTRATSRHNQGRAMDIVLPGVREEALAAFLRRQGFVGVGVYPNSGFTHLDVRARSYYWVDRSGPDQASQTTPVRANEIVRNDAAARRRGEQPTADLVPGAAESDEGRPSGEEAAQSAGTNPDAPTPAAPAEPGSPGDEATGTPPTPDAAEAPAPE